MNSSPQATGLTFGAMDEKSLVGAVTLLRETGIKTKHKGLLVGMYVRKPHRQQGIGSALVRRLLAAAEEKPELLIVQLTVSAHNFSATRLYERHGFMEFGLEPFAMSNGSEFIAKRHFWRSVKPLM